MFSLIKSAAANPQTRRVRRIVLDQLSYRMWTCAEARLARPSGSSQERQRVEGFGGTPEPGHRAAV